MKNTKLQIDNEFLKNLVSTGNICGILNQVSEKDKYKFDKEKRDSYLNQFRDVF